jgi:uncharacterized protein YoxC
VLRFLASIACIAVTVAAVLVAIVAWRTIDTSRDVDRLVDDAQRTVDRLDRSARDLGPAVRDLRSAARTLQQGQSALAP